MMGKVCVCGKGGSGKSTVVALLAAELCRRGRQVLVVDSDESNAGLHRLLGFDEPPRPLLELAGGKKNVRRVLRSGSPSEPEDSGPSVLTRANIRPEDIPAGYVLRREAMAMVAVGKIHQALEGCACPMGVLSREFLKRLRLDDDQFALVDTEAGVEHFGRGVEESVDSVIAVAEPSLESVSLAAKIRDLAVGCGARFAGVVVNKIPDDETERLMLAAIGERNLPVVGKIRHRGEIALAGLAGRMLPVNLFGPEVVRIADALLKPDGLGREVRAERAT